MKAIDKLAWIALPVGLLMVGYYGYLLIVNWIIPLIGIHHELNRIQRILGH